ncbi:MAG: ABC transporter substrate-binding protein [Chloroflexi bacterium]|nr:ABC transporter substrate-binding protein [Chloroflexota bacterium]
MIRLSSKFGLVALVVVLLALPLLAGCGGDDEKGTAKSTSQTGEFSEVVTITIGNLTDKTGPIANALSVIDIALEDMARYFNEQNLIPGVELEVIHYDGQYDPARHIPGYKWLRDKGADLIYAADPNAIETLKSVVDKDEVVLFASSAQDVLLEQPGYAFTAGTHPADLYYTFLDWIAENDWDYATKGPAKIGLAGWAVNIEFAMAQGLEKYCNDHPEKFEWEGEYLTDMGFIWQSEAQALKDCDYVVPPPGSLVTFVKEYREADGKAKFLGSDPHVAFFALVSDAGVWNKIDGMLMIREAKWWNEEGELIDLINKLAHDYHSPGELEKITKAGVSYLSASHSYIMMQIIKNAAEAVGPANIDSQALYAAAQSYALDLDGVQRYSFTDTKRFGCDNFGVYEVNVADETIYRVGTERLPIILAR